MLEMPNPDAPVIPNGLPVTRFRYVHAPRWAWVHLRSPYQGASFEMLMNPPLSLRGQVSTVAGMVAALPKIIRQWTLEDEQGQVRPITPETVGEWDDDLIEVLMREWAAAREAPKATSAS